MNQECTTDLADTSNIATIEPSALYISRVGGGSVSVERHNGRIADAVGRHPSPDEVNTLVVRLSDVPAPEDRCDSVYLDADQDREVETFDRAIQALQIAREAFIRTKV